jgi:hypothetical protein
MMAGDLADKFASFAGQQARLLPYFTYEPAHQPHQESRAMKHADDQNGCRDHTGREIREDL